MEHCGTSPIKESSCGGGGGAVVVPVPTPTRALAEFRDKLRKPKIPSTSEATLNLRRGTSSTSVETAALESGWRYEEKQLRQIARMASEVPGDAPPYEGASIATTAHDTPAMGDRALGAHCDEGVDVGNNPVLVDTPSLPSPEAPVPCEPTAPPQELPSNTAAMVGHEGDGGGNSPPAPAPDGDDHVGPAPSKRGGLYGSELDLIDEFTKICESPFLDGMAERYQKMDHQETDRAVAEAMAHPSLYAYEAYVNTLMEVMGQGPFKFMSNPATVTDQLAGFACWCEAERVCNDHTAPLPDPSAGVNVEIPTPSPSPPIPASEPPAAPASEPASSTPMDGKTQVASIKAVLTRATTVDLNRGSPAEQPPAGIEPMQVSSQPAQPAPAKSSELFGSCVRAPPYHGLTC